MTTIEQLERDVWPDPGPEVTSLVRRCTELRRKPLVEFTVEDLRIMLGQEIVACDPHPCGRERRTSVASPRVGA
ncbi:contact-dependent growth inhibition system immunity protein [Micromonospora sp. NPDC049836]|uniref:contact-dependent growth inhibition system immunity protein n=1 Tax=Micromonospora sp. NPDC049836 TaxID=3364274 RepID=UPI003795D827